MGQTCSDMCVLHAVVAACLFLHINADNMFLKHASEMGE